MTYHQITFAERYTLGVLRQRGLSPAAIARMLGRHRNTISREVRRNRTPRDGGYRPQLADWYARGRRSRSRRNQRFGPAARARIRTLLEDDWSPEQVAMPREVPCCTSKLTLGATAPRFLGCRSARRTLSALAADNAGEGTEGIIHGGGVGEDGRHVGLEDDDMSSRETSGVRVPAPPAEVVLRQDVILPGAGRACSACLLRSHDVRDESLSER